VIQFGIDRLIGDIKLLRELEGRRVALLAHPASMTAISSIRSMRCAACAGSTSRRHSARSMGCAATSRTT
jgi:hypothetical protein